MSTSLLACAIDARECVIIRLNTSGDSEYNLSGCKTFPFGLEELASTKGSRLLNKLDNQLNEWPDEELALCITPTNYLPLPVSFPANLSAERCREYCRIEAQYFLSQPEEYDCDCTAYGIHQNGAHEKKMLLFYPAAASRKVSEHLAASHRLIFNGTPQLPLLHLSRFCAGRQVILEIESNYLLLTESIEGRILQFSCQEVKNRKESELFTIKALVENPLCGETEIKLTGTLADKAMTRLIRKKTSMLLKPLNIPPSLSINNPFPISSAVTVKAISTALMALDSQKRFTLFT